MQYARTRGANAESRCTDYHERYGSPLYCECGCQIPRTDDLNPSQLEGLSLSWVDNRPFNEPFIGVYRGAGRVGSIDYAHEYLSLDGNEYLGCAGSGWENLKSLRSTLGPRPTEDVSPGSTLEETAAQVRDAEKIELAEQDDRHKDHAGYCSICHSFCYGDCQS